MPVARYHTTGGYTRSGGGIEPWYSIKPRLGGLRPGIFYLHGAGGEETALWPTWSPNSSQLMWRLAEFYSVFAPDCSTSVQTDGAHTWGNDGSTDTLDAAITYTQANPDQFQMSTGKVILFGASMGHVVACNYARRFPSKVAAIVGLAGATDVDFHYANGYGTNIDAAYGGSWANNGKTPVSHSPLDFANTLLVPHRYYYATDDPVVPPTGAGSYVPFHANYGGTHDAIAMGTGGHSDTPIANIDWQSLLSFVGSVL